MTKKRPRGDQARLILPYERTIVGSIFPESGLAVPFANTIVQSVTPLVWAQPDRAPELVTWIASPGFRQNEHFTIHAWPIIMASPEKESHLSALGRNIAKQVTVTPYVKRYPGKQPGDIRPFVGVVQAFLWLMLSNPETGFAAKWTLKETLEKALGGYLAKLPEYVRQQLEDEREVEEEPRLLVPSIEIWYDNLRNSPAPQEEPPQRRKAELWSDICDPNNLQAILEGRDELQRFIEIVRLEADPRKERYLQCLAEGMSLNGAANAVGVSTATGWKWRKDLKQRLAR